MRLADFIATNLEPILAEWEAFARPARLLACLKNTTGAARGHEDGTTSALVGRYLGFSSGHQN